MIRALEETVPDRTSDQQRFLMKSQLKDILPQKILMQGNMCA